MMGCYSTGVLVPERTHTCETLRTIQGPVWEMQSYPKHEVTILQNRSEVEICPNFWTDLDPTLVVWHSETLTWLFFGHYVHKTMLQSMWWEIFPKALLATTTFTDNSPTSHKRVTSLRRVWQTLTHLFFPFPVCMSYKAHRPHSKNSVNSKPFIFEFTWIVSVNKLLHVGSSLFPRVSLVMLGHQFHQP